jgi:hypothetical protein
MGRFCGHEGYRDGIRLWGWCDADEQQSTRAGRCQMVFDQLRERFSHKPTHTVSSSVDIAIRDIGGKATLDTGTAKSRSIRRSNTKTTFQSND